MKLISNNKPIDVQWLTFSDSAITCRIDPDAEIKNYISIDVTDETNSIPIMKEKLEMLMDALWENYVDEMNATEHILMLGYLPYGRADRLFQKGNPNPLVVFQIWLSGQNFDEVYIDDPHNQKALFSDINYKIKSQADCAKEVFKQLSTPNFSCYDYIVAPDAGAVPKIKELSEMTGLPILYATKKRNLETGRIESIDLNSDFMSDKPIEDSRVLIVDDILDGGGTFIPLAKRLNELGYRVDLYVTHLIGSKGLSIFSDYIDSIYAYNLIGQYNDRKDLNVYNETQRINRKF